MCIYIKQMEREEKLTHGGGSDGGLIGPSVATQSKYREPCRNLPVTSLIRPSKRMIE